MEIISALKEANLIGLGGAGFPTWQKWQAVKNSQQSKRFLICNISEGEPGVFKDEYILQKHLPELIAGIEVAAGAISAFKSYIFLNDKFNKYLAKIKKATSGKKIEIFIDTGRYLCGEETVLLQVMENKLRQPRSKPPYPTSHGLYNYPTLIHNPETLYRAYLISQDNYLPKQFISLTIGKRKKIIEIEIDATVEKILSGEKFLGETKFVRIGGASGYFLAKEKLDQKIESIAAIEVFCAGDKILDALVDSVRFLKSESCGKCTPCREGSYRIAQQLNNLIDSSSLWDRKEIVEIISEIAKTAASSSFCGLGASITRPVMSAIDNFKQELVGE